MQKIILASQSKPRRELFSSLGISFVTIPADIDEKAIRDEDLKIRAEKIARTKGEKIEALHKGIVVSADTFSYSNGKVFEKPKDIEEAKETLSFLSDQKAINYTGFCYIDRANDIDFSTTVITSYSLRTLYKSEIEEYVQKFPVLEWAAGFALISPYILSFIKYVEGSYTALSYGLPTELLIPLLVKSGFEPYPVK